MAMEPWERDYTTRTWRTYEVVPHSQDEPAMQRSRRYFAVCHADSEMARQLGYNANRFYVDYEMVAAGIDPLFGGDGPHELAVEWRGHPAGSLIYRVYTGMKKNPPTWTYMVQTPDA
jgi:hypothetical protein